MSEKLSDGRTIVGGPTDVKGKTTLSIEELKLIKNNMYRDFLTAKQEGKIALGYSFESWLRDSLNTLRTLRKADIDTEHRIGKISTAEYDALDEMRQKLISAILQMDISELDKYGVQFIDPTIAQVIASQQQPLDSRLLIPNHRKDLIKFKRPN